MPKACKSVAEPGCKPEPASQCGRPPRPSDPKAKIWGKQSTGGMALESTTKGGAKAVKGAFMSKPLLGSALGDPPDPEWDIPFSQER